MPMPWKRFTVEMLLTFLDTADEADFAGAVAALQEKRYDKLPLAFHPDAKQHQRIWVKGLAQAAVSKSTRRQKRAHALFTAYSTPTLVVRRAMASTRIPIEWKLELLDRCLAHIKEIHYRPQLCCGYCNARNAMLHSLLEPASNSWTRWEGDGLKVRRRWQALEKHRPRIFEQMIELARGCRRAAIVGLIYTADPKATAALKTLYASAPAKPLGKHKLSP